MLSPDDTRLLDRLTLEGASLSTSASVAGGHRRARTRGAGLEFHEYRHYQPGDDPRSIDWTVEARFRQLVVRESKAEGHIRLHILMDISGSMGLGSPDKLACARKIAAALCYVAVERREAAGMSSFNDRIRTHLPPTSGRAQLFRVLEALGSARASGRSAIEHALVGYASAVRGPGLVAVLSDFFDTGDSLRGLRYLLHKGLTPAVLHIASPDEIRPDFLTEMELIDIEHEGSATVVVDPASIAAYRSRFDAHAASLRSFCAAHGLPWVMVESTMTFKELLSALQRAGMFSAYA